MGWAEHPILRRPLDARHPLAVSGITIRPDFCDLDAIYSGTFRNLDGSSKSRRAVTTTRIGAAGRAASNVNSVGRQMADSIVIDRHSSFLFAQ